MEAWEQEINAGKSSMCEWSLVVWESMVFWKFPICTISWAQIIENASVEYEAEGRGRGKIIRDLACIITRWFYLEAVGTLKGFLTGVEIAGFAFWEVYSGNRMEKIDQDGKIDQVERREVNKESVRIIKRSCWHVSRQLQRKWKGKGQFSEWLRKS